MPTNLLPNPSEQIIESHEDRITRVEDATSKLSTQLATNTERLESLSQMVELTFDKIAQKVDNGISAINLSITNHVEKDKEFYKKVEVVSDRFERVDNRVDRLEEKAAHSKKKWDLAKKIAIPLLLALGGVIFERLGMVVWTWLSHG